MTWRIPINNLELEALRMSGAEQFCEIVRPHDGWRKVAEFASFGDMIQAHGKIRNCTPEHGHRKAPYLSLCRKIAIINLGSERDQ